MVKKTQLILLLGFVFMKLWGQDVGNYADELPKFKFDQITIDDGLANSTIKLIIQDRKGYIWFAALNSLCRYDAYGFKTYKHNPKNSNSLSGSRITALSESPDGELLIGTWQDGLDVVDSKTDSIKHFRFDQNNIQSIGSNKIGAIFIDKSNRIWVGAGNTLNLFDKTKETFKRFYLQDKDLAINSIAENTNGKIMVITNQLKTFCLNWSDESFAPLDIIPTSHQYPSIWRCRFYVDSNGVIWICSVNNGLYRYDPKTGQTENFREDKANPYSLTNNEVYDIVEDKNNQFWIATDGGGLNYFDYGSKRFYGINHEPLNSFSISNNKPHCLLKDDTGILWIGFYNGGVSVYDKNKFKFKSFAHSSNDNSSIGDNIVWCFLEDKDGDIWIGTDKGGLNLYKPAKYGDQFERYTHDPDNFASIPTNTVITLFQDSRDIIWLGTYNKGLVQFDKKRNVFNSYLTKEKSALNQIRPIGFDVWDIEEDTQGKLWLATLRYGIDVFDVENDKLVRYTAENSNLSNNQATTIFKDSKNQIWVGTADGLNLYSYKFNNFKVFRHNPNDTNSLPGNNIRHIFEDKAHNLWIGTEGSGLSQMNPVDFSFVNYSEQDGLPSNVIYGVLEDKNGKLWISTSMGLSKLDIETGEFRNYSKNEGLQSNEFKQNSCLETKSGKMFFGGINGFNIFCPDSIKDNPNPPQVMLTGFNVRNKSMEVGAVGSPLTQNLDNLEKIYLSYNQSDFSFSFAALNYTIPENNQYAYMLEGFDNSWNYVGNKREANYTNVGHGEYVFKVIASNNDNVWNTNGASIKIKINPPWWKTFIFRTFVALAIIWAAVSFYLYRINLVKRKNEELGKQVAIRTQELILANEDLKMKKEEILAQNEEIQQQTEEIITQRDEIQQQNKKLAQSYDKIKTLSKFGKGLTSFLNINTINETFYNYVNSLLDTSIFGVALLNEKENKIEFAALIENGKPFPKFSSSLDDPTSCAAWCIKNQEIIFNNNFTKEYKTFISEWNIKSTQTPESILYLPLTVKDKKIGVLTVQSYKPNAYSDNDLQTLQMLASYIAIAIDNANAYHIVNLQKKELEQHRQKLEKLVFERTKDLETAKSKAEESEKLKSAFLSNISHEIRTPLNAIVGFTPHLVKKTQTDEVKNEIIQIIEDSAFSLIKLIDDIIEFSNIEAGEIKITFTDVNIELMLKEMFQKQYGEIKKLNKENNIKFVLNMDSVTPPPIVKTDSIRLWQIINNLLENAIKYTDNGQIEFGYNLIDNKYVNFYVSDTGIGIDKKHFDAVFDRFMKIEGSEEIYRGTGLGLTITKYLVERLGGKIWVESKLGEGSKFEFDIPLNKQYKDD